MTHELFGKFDIAILETFKSFITDLSINAHVQLSSGKVGKIIYIDNKYPTRPVVQLDYSKKIIPLADHKNLEIEAIDLLWE